MTLPEFSVKRKVTVAMIVMIILFGGVVSFFSVGLDFMPEIDYPIISVVTKYEGVASEEIENIVTKPVEEAVSALKGIKNIYSVSMEGASVVLLEFQWGTNLDFAAQDARESLEQMRIFIPAAADKSIVMKFDLSQMPVLFYGIHGGRDTVSLRKFLKDNIVPRLERLPGVAAVMIFGGDEREINIFADRSRMNAIGISSEEIIRAVQTENANVSAGNITEGHLEFFVRTLGEFKSIGEIENTVIKRKGGALIYVKDVAEVVDTVKERRDIVRLDGKEAVMMFVSKQSGSNTVLVCDGVKKEIKRLKKLLSLDMEFSAVMDQSHIIKKILKKTFGSIFIGGILAICFLYLFLRNVRPTFGIAVAIPISLITTFVGLFLMGYTFNVFTLIGYALVVGMLVDNAIVVIENTFRHLESGKDRVSAAVAGADEVTMAITTSTLTTVAVFLPMAISSGLAGQLSRPLALTIVMGLLASLFTALTIIPLVASTIFKADADRGKGKFIEKIKEKYRALLTSALANKWKVVIGGICVFLLSLLLLFKTGFEFIPEGDIPMTTLMVSLPVGTDIKETDRITKKAAEDFIELPENMYVMEWIGRSSYGETDAAMGTGPSDVHEAMILSRMTDLEDRDRKISDIIEELRGKMPPLKDSKFTFSDISQSMSGGAQMPFEMKIFGKDLKKLENIALELSERIRKVEGIRDLNVSIQKGKPEYQIKIKRDKAAYYSLHIAQIGDAVRNFLSGKVASKYRVGGEEYDIRVRLRKSQRKDLKDIENFELLSPLGVAVNLKDVAEISRGYGPLKIERENRLRKVTISANIKDRPVGKVISDVKKTVGNSFPDGYFAEYGGTYKQMKESMGDLLLAFFAAVLLIYMIMAAQFESFLEPFVIMFSVPLAVTGVLVGLVLRGMALSVPAMMGVIILAGIVVNNGIVMISFINQLRRNGMDKYDAVVEGASVRLRPILITALTTIAGTMPLALSTGSTGGHMRGPIGTAVVFGLLFSTVLTLFVIPCLYAIVDRISRISRKKISQILE